MTSDWNVKVKRRVYSLFQFFIEILSFNTLQEIQDNGILKMRDLFKEKLLLL